MSDAGDYWRDVKSGMQDQRRERLAQAKEALPRVRDMLDPIGVVVVVSNAGTHWQFLTEDSRVIGDYWPSAQKARLHRARRSLLGVTLTQIVAWVKKHA